MYGNAKSGVTFRLRIKTNGLCTPKLRTMIHSRAWILIIICRKPPATAFFGVRLHNRQRYDIREMFDVANEIDPMSEGAEETWRKNVGIRWAISDRREKSVRQVTDVEVIPILLRRELSSLPDYAMPAIVSAGFMDLCCSHDELEWHAGAPDEGVILLCIKVTSIYSSTVGVLN